MTAPPSDLSVIFDVLIIGAGLSGINAAYRLQQKFPRKRYAVLEARDRLGGTWSFWRYPGVRSDSGMALFGLPWHPWPSDANMADGALLAAYLSDAAKAHGIDRHVCFRHRAVAAAWNSAEQRWTLSVDVYGDVAEPSQSDHVPGTGPGPAVVVDRRTFAAPWLISCTGYYDYEHPLPAVIPGLDQFAGQVIHPQFWPEGETCANKRVVIIGSGATAVTLLPALAKTAHSVTMLQRSPSYVATLPRRDRLLSLFRRLLPTSWAVLVNWWLGMILETVFVQAVLRYPDYARKLIMTGMRRQLPAHVDVDKHFNPSYPVFDQRLCFCPDGDFFKALHRDNCQVVTDTIDTVTETGIRTSSGQDLEADVIVTATGLNMRLLSGMPLVVDGVPIGELGKLYTWHGCMLEGVPNAGTVVGYLAGTWTPGADARTRMLLRVMGHMDKVGATAATPFISEQERRTLPRKPAVPNSSTYIRNAIGRLPMSADVGPWRNGKTWIADFWSLMFADVKTGMRYTIPDKSKTE